MQDKDGAIHQLGDKDVREYSAGPAQAGCHERWWAVNENFQCLLTDMPAFILYPGKKKNSREYTLENNQTNDLQRFLC